MNTPRRYPRTVLAGMLGLAIAGTTACERRVSAGATPLTAATPYGVVPGTAYDVWTPAHMQGATIPVTLPDGRQAHLVIAPTSPPATAQPVVLRESVVAPRVQTV
jgi:hypothetical protein